LNELFKITHSVLDNNWVGAACAQHYDLEANLYCELLHRGMNDVYMLRTSSTKYAVRAWRANWRTMDDVAYELEYLDFLRDSGIGVAPAIRTKDGHHYFTVEAPEGPRVLAVFEWAPGRKFAEQLDEDMAVRLGEIMANIHDVGANFEPTKMRRTNHVSIIEENLPLVQRMVSDRPGEEEFYSNVVVRLVEAFEQVDMQAVPMGACHGDFHLYNVHIASDGNIIFLDFDNAGWDYYLSDVISFVWINEYCGQLPVYAQRFVEGYESKRPFSDAERAHIPLFILAMELRQIAEGARHVNTVGHALLRFQDLDWFARSIRRHAEEAGIV